ncbi:MAG: YIP1 family protein [Candidatus Aenigmarchaeota archaeon]|nr:YIP1 family protein [Candidatus Aenigmarchaeota archaeon]
MAKKLGINPWFTMWYKPRETIRKIIKYDPRYMVLLLAAATGFSSFLSSAAQKSMGDYLTVPFIFLLALSIGSILGIAGLYISGWLIRWTGKWIGGKASPLHIRTVIAWSNVPIVWGLILTIFELLIFGETLFTGSTMTLTLFIFVFGAIELALGIWAFVILLRSLGEVQKFSAWKALLNVFLSALIIVLPIMIISALGLLYIAGSIY